MDSIKGKFEAVWQSLLTDMLKWVKVSPFMHYSPFSVRMWCHYPFSCFSISTPTALWPKPFPKEGQNRPFQSLTGGKSNPGKHRNEASIVWRKLLIHPDFTNRERDAVLMNLSFIWSWKNTLMLDCMVRVRTAIKWLVTRFVWHCTHLSCSLVAHEQRPLHWRHCGCCHPWCHLTCCKWMNGHKFK